MQPSHRFLAVLAVAAALFLPALPIDAQEPAPPSQKIHKAHAIAMHGEPAYGPDFKHFDYVNPNAPKGGTLILSADGTFDTRSEEHTSELQSLMRISYAVFCLKKQQ